MYKLLALVLILLPNLALAAIAYDAGAGPYVNNPVTSQTTAFTVGAGSNRLLVVGVLGDSAASSGITGITYAGDAMTKALTERNDSSRAFDVWYLANPDSGSNNVVITRGVSGLIVSAFTAYSGVDQSTPVPTTAAVDDGSSNNTFSGAIVTANNNSWAGVFIREEDGGTITDGAGLDTRVTNVGNGIHMGDSGVAIAVAGSHTFNAGWSGNFNDAAIMWEMKEAAAAATPAKPILDLVQSFWIF